MTPIRHTYENCLIARLKTTRRTLHFTQYSRRKACTQESIAEAVALDETRQNTGIRQGNATTGR